MLESRLRRQQRIAEARVTRQYASGKPLSREFGMVVAHAASVSQLPGNSGAAGCDGPSRGHVRCRQERRLHAHPNGTSAVASASVWRAAGPARRVMAWQTGGVMGERAFTRRASWLPR